MHFLSRSHNQRTCLFTSALSLSLGLRLFLLLLSLTLSLLSLSITPFFACCFSLVIYLLSLSIFYLALSLSLSRSLALSLYLSLISLYPPFYLPLYLFFSLSPYRSFLLMSRQIRLAKCSGETLPFLSAVSLSITHTSLSIYIHTHIYIYISPPLSLARSLSLSFSRAISLSLMSRHISLMSRPHLANMMCCTPPAVNPQQQQIRLAKCSGETSSFLSLILDGKPYTLSLNTLHPES